MFLYSFSPLRYWGSLYQYNEDKEKRLSFSPLRYWGSLYRMVLIVNGSIPVLVPFDIGVVYI